MVGIFISYRRADSRGSAGRLYDDLSERFGTDRVFRDLDGIDPGARYEDVIDTAISNCVAVIVVMGNTWLDSDDASGQRRVDNPEDLLRIEIGRALARDKFVIPVLVEDAKMPAEADLPPDLAPLAERNALSVSDERWDYDVGRLVAILEKLLGPAAPENPGRSTTGQPVAPPIETGAQTAWAGPPFGWGRRPLLHPVLEPSRPVGRPDRGKLHERGHRSGDPVCQRHPHHRGVRNGGCHRHPRIQRDQGSMTRQSA